VLFIGESPPASGRFFYQRDSGLYRAMLAAFERNDSSVNHDNFLATFRSAGCYLIDLCPDPVDDLEAKTRRAVCRASEPMLARAIRRLQPRMIVTVVRSIEENVTRAAEKSRWQGPVQNLPYPGRWSRYKKAFVEPLAETLARRHVDAACDKIAS
jgi:hypothetical protein